MLASCYPEILIISQQLASILNFTVLTWLFRDPCQLLQIRDLLQRFVQPPSHLMQLSMPLGLTVTTVNKPV